MKVKDEVIDKLLNDLSIKAEKDLCSYEISYEDTKLQYADFDMQFYKLLRDLREFNCGAIILGYGRLFYSIQQISCKHLSKLKT